MFSQKMILDMKFRLMEDIRSACSNGHADRAFCPGRCMSCAVPVPPQASCPIRQCHSYCQQPDELLVHICIQLRETGPGQVAIP